MTRVNKATPQKRDVYIFVFCFLCKCACSLSLSRHQGTSQPNLHTNNTLIVVMRATDGFKKRTPSRKGKSMKMLKREEGRETRWKRVWKMEIRTKRENCDVSKQKRKTKKNSVSKREMISLCTSTTLNHALLHTTTVSTDVRCHSIF